ncbi:DUF3795 domain-containing protein [Chloroflexota bacterium]
MSKDELAAPCGLYCGCCYIYKANDDKVLAKDIAQKWGIKPEEAKCRGCVEEKGACKMLFHGAVCPTYECAVNQNGLRFCYECEDFPCLKLAPAADRAHEIPHNMKIYNLISIQRMGLKKWLEEAEQKWNQYYQGKKPRGGSELQF